MTRLVLLLAIALLSTAPTLAIAQPLRYLGRAADVPGGVITLGGHAHDDIHPGTDVPGWGRVTDVRDDRIVIERIRTDAEKEEMARRGALPHDVLEIHVLRDELREPSGTSTNTHR